MCAFGMAASATNKDDDTRIGMIGYERQEVVATAGDQKQFAVAGITEHLGMIGVHREHLPSSITS
jgi:hypothetical protein